MPIETAVLIGIVMALVVGIYLFEWGSSRS